MYRILFFICLLLPLGTFAQGVNTSVDTPASKHVLGKITTYYTDHIAEQAYLHFDKPYYAAGDTIYFKAYITAGEKHQLSAISGILYVDLIGNGTIYQSLKLQVINGVAWGDFALPDTLKKGNYQVRAYTRWMLNYGSDNYFTKIIPVGSVITGGIPEAAVVQPKKLNKPDVQFFPEGGGILNDIDSKVAFKAVGSDGLGIDVKGELLDNENKQVLTFASAHLGMGSFSFYPGPGKTYRAKLTYPDGTGDTFALPAADTKGVVLSVNNNSPAGALIKIAASKPYYLSNKNKKFTVIIYSGGDLLTFVTPLEVPQIEFNVLKRTMHTGIATVTLFSPTGEPLSERLLFVQNNDQLNVSVNSDKPIYAKREKVSFKLNTRDGTGNPSSGYFSVSVIDEGKVPVAENNEHTILTDLLLTDDLKGYVEQPNYYFTNITDKTNADLDLVMLTHGYRRFEWKKILNNEYPPITLQPENSLEINGTVKFDTGEPFSGGTVYLLPLSGAEMQVQKVGDNGAFKFNNLMFADGSRFHIKAQGEGPKKNTLLTYTPPGLLPVKPDSSRLFEQGDINNQMSVYLQNEQKQQEENAKYNPSKGVLLKDVKVKDKTYESSNIGGSGYADQVLQRSDFKNYGNGPFSSVFSYRLHGVKFMGDNGHKSAYLVEQRALEKVTTPMLIVVDGIQYDPYGLDVDDLVNVEDIQTIEVLTSATASIYGINGAAGVLVITTRRGNDKDENSVTASGVLTIAPKGFYNARVFYSPKYEHKDNSVTREDLRSTIYWNPELTTGKDGNASFDYYNADGAGSYRVVIEGIDSRGNLGQQVYRYKVE